MADSAAVPETFGLEKPLQTGKEFERGTLRGKTEQPQVSVFGGSFAGKDRGDRTAGVAELHIDFFAVGQKFRQKIVIVDDLPAQGVYE